jgi:hypothetical protein
MTRSNSQDTDGLRALLAAIAGSPIVVAAAAERPVRTFADWCEQQAPADIDRVILAWIASHVPARTATKLC